MALVTVQRSPSISNSPQSSVSIGTHNCHFLYLYRLILVDFDVKPIKHGVQYTAHVYENYVCM